MGNKADPTYTVIAISKRGARAVHATGKSFDARVDANAYIAKQEKTKRGQAWDYVRVRCTPGPVARKK